MESEGIWRTQKTEKKTNKKTKHKQDRVRIREENKGLITSLDFWSLLINNNSGLKIDYTNLWV